MTGDIGGPRPLLLTAAEAAHLLQLNEGTLRDYARRRLLPSVKVGRHLRFIEGDLVQWLERERVGGLKAP